MTPQELRNNYPRTVVALVTPITRGEIDEQNLRTLIQFHLEAATPAVLLCGTTGESATMSHPEHKRVIEIGVETVSSWKKKHPECRTQLWAGTGSNSTKEALDLTIHAEKAGADVALVITPYYNKPTPAGLIHHYQTLAEAVSFPIVMYNVPGRTGVNMIPSVVRELAQIPNIVGVKEASGNISQIMEIVMTTPDDFLLWSGEDAQNLPILSVGGIGAISVTANVVPWDVEAVARAFEKGDNTQALYLHQKLVPLHDAMFVETNPIPVKTALKILREAYASGGPEGAPEIASRLFPKLPDVGEFRAPLVPIGQVGLEKLKKALREYRLL